MLVYIVETDEQPDLIMEASEADIRYSKDWKREEAGDDVRIGIVGTGKAAASMAQTIRHMQQGGQAVSLHGIASRDATRAKEFAARWGAEKAYGSFDQLLEDPLTDLVYIAIPHAFHAGYMHRCIDHGKAVLCEKTFTLNAREAEDIFAHAQERGVYVADGLWTRYMPVWQEIAALLKEGAIGVPCMLKAESCAPAEQVERIRSAALGGGALLDMGVYALHFARSICGETPAVISSTADFMPSGPDRTVEIHMQASDGMLVQLRTSVADDCRACVGGVIYGTAGCMLVDSIIRPGRVEVLARGSSMPVRTMEVPREGTGYEYEVAACMRDLAAGAAEPRELPHAETLALLRQMDQIRTGWQSPAAP